MTATRLPAGYATTTELGAGPATATHDAWSVVRQRNTEFDEMVVRVDAAFDLSRDEDRAELVRVRDAITAALGAIPTRVQEDSRYPLVRYLEVVEISDSPWHLNRLTPAWRERLRGLIRFTSSNHEDVWDCADCGDQNPTPVGYRFTEATCDGLEFEWCPTVGVLENGVLRWLCDECGTAIATASAAQVEQAAKHLSAGVKW